MILKPNIIKIRIIFQDPPKTTTRNIRTIDETTEKARQTRNNAAPFNTIILRVLILLIHMGTATKNLSKSAYTNRKRFINYLIKLRRKALVVCSLSSKTQCF